MEDALLVNGAGGPALRGWRSAAPGLLDISPPGSSLPVLCALLPTCPGAHALVSDSQIGTTVCQCRMRWLSARASHTFHASCDSVQVRLMDFMDTNPLPCPLPHVVLYFRKTIM